MDPEDAWVWTGREAWETWKDRLEAAFVDDPMPEWQELTEDQQAKWDAAVACIPMPG